MKTLQVNPLITEVRAVREEHAARFGYDVKAIFKDIRSRQEASGRKCVRYPARRIYPESEIKPSQEAEDRVLRSNAQFPDARCRLLWHRTLRKGRDPRILMLSNFGRSKANVFFAFMLASSSLRRG